MKMCTDHDLRLLIADLGAILNGPSPQDKSELGRIRWAFARWAIDLMAHEGSSDFQKQFATATVEDRATLKTYRAMLNVLHADYMAHMAFWQGWRIESEWADYKRAERTILDKFEKQMRFEELHLLPLLIHDDTRHPSRAPASISAGAC